MVASQRCGSGSEGVVMIVVWRQDKEHAVDKIMRAITNIDISRNARFAGDLGSAENALDVARRELIEVLGIINE